jgi:hypothetical protein
MGRVNRSIECETHLGSTPPWAGVTPAPDVKTKMRDVPVRILLGGASIGVALFCATMVRAQMPASPLIVSETSVIRFAPAVPGGDAREGACWTESIAVTRPGAWRCMVGNAISDPCFTVASKANREQLVCDADPALKRAGFVLKLTKPLPRSSSRQHRAEPWIFRLADNSICEAMTGTLPAVNGVSARWSCAIHIRDQVRPVGVVTELIPGKIWMADKFPQSAIVTQGAVAEKVPVKVVWE